MKPWPIIPLLFAAVGAFAQLQSFDTGEWADLRIAAQDGNGKVYAAGSEECKWVSWSDNWQPSFSSPWMNSSSSVTVGAKPFAFEETRDGRLFSVWERTANHGVILCTLGPDVMSFRQDSEGPAKLFRMFVDSQSNLWTTSAGMHIYETRHSEYNRNRLIHTIMADELTSSHDATSRQPVAITEDSRGRIWFWSDYQAIDSASGAIKGVIIAEGDEITHHAALGGMPLRNISRIALMEKTNLWIALHESGIYSIDPETLTGKLLPAPAPEAFHDVQNMFAIGADQYVISGSANQFNEAGLVSALWQRRDGHWTKLIDGLDNYGTRSQLASRQWRETTDGLWLGAPSAWAGGLFQKMIAHRARFRGRWIPTCARSTVGLN